MKESILKTHKNQQGFVVPVIFLILMPLLLAVTIGTINISQAVDVGDVDIQEAVAIASKAGAGRINSSSQAAGMPHIDCNAARDSFRKILAGNLGLDNTSLQPLDNTAYASAPKYWLLVYNGDSNFGTDRAILYYFDGTTETNDTGIGGNGFPQQFTISESSITSGSGGDYTVELNSPGVIALVAIAPKKVFGVGEPAAIQRWASARVVWDD